MGPGGHIGHWSKGCERLYGWREAEAQGEVVHHLLETSFPEPIEDIHAKVQRHGSWSGELARKRKDESKVFVASLWIGLHRRGKGSTAGAGRARTRDYSRCRGRRPCTPYCGRAAFGCGYGVVEAESGAEALQRLADHPEISLVFTDMVMPGGMTGNELAHRVRRFRPEMKILVTSGYAAPSLAKERLPEGASWLLKPYTARKLSKRLRELLD